MRHESRGRRLSWILALVLPGCGTIASHEPPRPPVVLPEQPPPDLPAVTSILEMMRTLPEGDPARQAELFEAAKLGASQSPTAFRPRTGNYATRRRARPGTNYRSSTGAWRRNRTKI